MLYCQILQLQLQDYLPIPLLFLVLTFQFDFESLICVNVKSMSNMIQSTQIIAIFWNLQVSSFAVFIASRFETWTFLNSEISFFHFLLISHFNVNSPTSLILMALLVEVKKHIGPVSKWIGHHPLQASLILSSLFLVHILSAGNPNIMTGSKGVKNDVAFVCTVSQEMFVVCTRSLEN